MHREKRVLEGKFPSQRRWESKEPSGNGPKCPPGLTAAPTALPRAAHHKDGSQVPVCKLPWAETGLAADTRRPQASRGTSFSSRQELRTAHGKTVAALAFRFLAEDSGTAFRALSVSVSKDAWSGKGPDAVRGRPARERRHPCVCRAPPAVPRQRSAAPSAGPGPGAQGRLTRHNGCPRDRPPSPPAPASSPRGASNTLSTRDRASAPRTRARHGRPRSLGSSQRRPRESPREPCARRPPRPAPAAVTPALGGALALAPAAAGDTRLLSTWRPRGEGPALARSLGKSYKT